MPIVLHTWSPGEVILPATLNADANTIMSILNGGILSEHLGASAGILPSQLANAYEHMDVQIHQQHYSGSAPFGSGWPATTQIAWSALAGNNADTGGAWQVTEVDWHCNNVGAGSGTWQLLYGGYTGSPPIWNTVLTVTSGTLTKSGASLLNSVAVTGLSVTLTQQSYPCQLVLYANAADATALSSDGHYISMVVRLRRLISAA